MMPIPHDTETLSLAILMLEDRKKVLYEQLKSDLATSYNSLKPLNIVKSGFREIVGSPEVKQGIFSNLVGLAGGFITKKMIIGPATGIVRNSLGTILQIIMTNLVTRKTAAMVAEETEDLSPSNKVH